ncbi:Fc.00g064750.m01.CDS01 [Cosmosporella sp. VM-42]
MCKTTVITHGCGHYYFNDHKVCEAYGKKPRRGCLGFFFGNTKPCWKTNVEKPTSKLCHQCLQDPSLRDVEVLRGVQQERMRQDESARRNMEELNRPRERDEAGRDRTRRQESSRHERQGVRNPPPTAYLNKPSPVAIGAARAFSRSSREPSRSSSSRRETKPRADRRAHSQRDVFQTQGRTRRDREMHRTRRHIPSAEDFLAAESRVVECQGIDWDRKLGHPQRPQYWTPQLQAQTAGFSSDGYKSYWDGVKGDPSAVSSVGEDDLDLMKYPIVPIPVNDEYSQYRV